VLTVLTRAFFVLPERDLPLPVWLREALRYAPIGAMVAVVVPEIVLTDGRLVTTWQDPRLAGTLAATLYFLWRRDMLGTIVTGTATLLLCRLGLGW
jgi:branched-subunit amino acid transport protein